jgi:glucose/arabinose dehydrogenase
VRRTAAVRVAGTAALIAAFLGGVVVGAKQYPPYEQLRDLTQGVFGDEDEPSSETGAPVPIEDEGSTVTASKLGDFEAPVYVTDAPGSTERLYVVEQAGTVSLLEAGRPLDQPFLDIRGLVGMPRPPRRGDRGIGGEAGLLSLAFAPDYERSRRFYVVFVNRAGDVELDEFRRLADSKVKAKTSSRRRLLTIDHSMGQNHYGGQLGFGPDGFLYMGTGDGGYPSQEAAAEGTTNHLRQARRRMAVALNAANRNSLLGKLLRIDPRPGRGRAYRIPAGNPFVGEPGRDEIYAYGLRNPWRFSFDGDLLTLADVGEVTREEINAVPVEEANGANFGWPHFEGTAVFAGGAPAIEPLVTPIYEYARAEGCAVVGGYVVHDPSLPSFDGRYLYGDFCEGQVLSLVPAEVGDDPPVAIGVDVPALSSFGEDAGGGIYAVSLEGGVYRLEED